MRCDRWTLHYFYFYLAPFVVIVCQSTTTPIQTSELVPQAPEFQSEMDLSSPKVTAAEKVDLCRKYFYFGFALLPFLWGVNAVWFFKEAFLVKPEYPEQKELKKLVVISGILALISLTAFVTWVAVFAQYRSEWGATADRLSFNIPTGST